ERLEAIAVGRAATADGEGETGGHDPRQPTRRERRRSGGIARIVRMHDAAQADRLDRVRNVEPETAELLGVLVRARAAPRVLEIGTSNGYSTIWLADAVAATGGWLVSLEVDPARTALARQHLARAGLADVADLRTSDAAQALAAFGDDAFDVVFLDAERPAYPGYWPELVRTLAPGGLLAVDN